MANIFPENWMTHEEALKEDNDRAQAKLMYWQRLRTARIEFADETGADPLTHVSKAHSDGFYYWMQHKYGIQLEFIDGNISGAYTILDEKKLTLFLLKHSR